MTKTTRVRYLMILANRYPGALVVVGWHHVYGRGRHGRRCWGWAVQLASGLTKYLGKTLALAALTVAS